MLSGLLKFEILSMFSTTNGKSFIPFFKTKKRKAEVVAPLALVDKKQHLKNLFKCHNQQIFRLCFQVTQNHETAETLTIKVFIQFYKEFENLDRNIKFKDYLRKLTLSHLINYKQQSKTFSSKS